MKDLEELYRNSRLKGCPVCGHSLEYKGLGEYFCSNCNENVYDDYGKVRKFVEEYPAASLVQIEEATGVDKNKIRDMVRDGKFILAGNRRGQLS
jgi:hypothetical protein